MRETEFIRQNKDKWQRYEAALERDDQDPELLKQLYIHTTDDLSYSRTFYPNRSVRVYLNGLAQRTFLQLYRGRRGEAGRFFTFWTDELPRVVHAQRRPLLIALATFVLAMLIGIVSYRIDDQFAATILGQTYVDMTAANIEGGDPMAVYKQTAPFEMSLRITFNNIFVALLTFVSGAFFAVGALVQLIRNGVMVGVFQYYFFDQGLLQESFLTIWMHGALEISSIVLAGGAGLAMGKGLLFPGTLSRFDAFKHSARDGLKIMLGLLPLFVIAGFLEGYVTRHTELPDAVRGAFILLCFVFMVWYYVLYPRVVAARAPLEQGTGWRESATEDGPLSLEQIRGAGSMLAAAFTVLRRHLLLMVSGAALLAAAYCLLSFFFYGSASYTRYLFDGSVVGDFHNIHEVLTSFSRDRGLFFLLLVAGWLYGIFRLTFRAFWRAAAQRWYPINWRSETFLYLVCVTIALGFAFNGIVTLLFVFLALPFLFTFAYAGYSGLATPRETFRYVYVHLVLTYTNLLMLILLAVPLLWLLDTTAAGLLFAFLDWVFYADQVTIDNANVVLQAFLYTFLFGIVFQLMSLAFLFNFYTVREIERASSLLDDIQAFGGKRRLRGMEVE
jgi:uncharacterized membrane protein SpoIIM required for sporulation